MSQILCIGGQYQLAEFARMFVNAGFDVTFADKRSEKRSGPIIEAGNRYSTFSLNSNGDFGREEIQLAHALSFGNPEQTKRFLEEGVSDLELITVGAHEITLRNEPEAPVWDRIADVVVAARDQSGPSKELEFLCSDNSARNHEVLRNRVLSAIERNYEERPEILEWARTNLHFYYTVVDRIVVKRPSKLGEEQISGFEFRDGLGFVDGQYSIFGEPSFEFSYKLVVENPSKPLRAILEAIPSSERVKIVPDANLFSVAKNEGNVYVHVAGEFWGQLLGLGNFYENLQHDILGPYILEAAKAKGRIVSRYKNPETGRGFFSNSKGLSPERVAKMVEEFALRCDNAYMDHRNNDLAIGGIGKVEQRVRQSVLATGGGEDKGLVGTYASLIAAKTGKRRERTDRERFYARSDDGEFFEIHDSYPLELRALSNLVPLKHDDQKAEQVREYKEKVAGLLLNRGGPFRLEGINPQFRYAAAELATQIVMGGAEPALKAYAPIAFSRTFK